MFQKHNIFVLVVIVYPEFLFASFVPLFPECTLFIYDML